jgi:hypothetical protein
MNDGSPFDQEQISLGGIAGFPYAGLNPVDSVLSVVSQAALGPNASTVVALNALLDALNNNNGPIDVIAYSGGAQAFATAYGELSSAQQNRIANVLYLSPGMLGTLVVPPNATVTDVYGWNYSADPVATVGTSIPWGVRTIPTPCDHMDIGCLLKYAPLAQITKDGSCSSQDVFSLPATTSLASLGIGGPGGAGALGGQGGGWGTNYQIFGWLDLIFGGVPNVTSTIRWPASQ